MEKEEFEKYIDSLISFNKLDENDKQSVEWIIEAVNEMNNDNIIELVEDSLSGWNSHLNRFEKEEEFEICAKIKSVMSIEIIDAMSFLVNKGDVKEEDIVDIMKIKFKYKL